MKSSNSLLIFKLTNPQIFKLERAKIALLSHRGTFVKQCYPLTFNRILTIDQESIQNKLVRAFPSLNFFFMMYYL